MALFDWTDALKVNVNVIDTQHRTLVDLLNRLHEAMRTGRSREVMGGILKDLVDYTVYHFGTEQSLFERYDYPERTSHTKEHDELTAKALDIRDRHEKGGLTLSVELLNFLRDWLSVHILGSDKKAAAFMSSKGLH